MNPRNLQVFEYLRTFCDSARPPQFAVLIKGKWGSGKTWFIEELCKKLVEDNINVLRISLYGLSSISEIDSQFFRLLHPILGSKSMALVGKLLKGALEASLKIDNESTEFNIKSAIPSLDISKTLTNLENAVLIFDDIHWSAEMEKAWEAICNHPAARCTIDLFFVGLVFLRREFHEPQHFRIRF